MNPPRHLPNQKRAILAKKSVFEEKLTKLEVLCKLAPHHTCSSSSGKSTANLDGRSLLTAGTYRESHPCIRSPDKP